ncbi:MAG: YfbM family protein [Deltaproteobacteria bacterium]|jgi:hypothetical protein|nr:YfbM family protein [Deltaproteobacteria bacterium]
MALLGTYMMIDSEDLETLMELEADELAEEMDILAGESDTHSIGALWDGLHFVLTGKSASDADMTRCLSKAVLGGAVLVNTEEALVAYNLQDELQAVLGALEKVDTDALRRGFDPLALAAANVYPDIWTTEDREKNLDNLVGELGGLVAFYRRTIAKKMNLIFSLR